MGNFTRLVSGKLVSFPESGGGGGFTTYATEDVAEGASITSSTSVSFQFRRVQGDSTPVTADTTPFGLAQGWTDGTIIRLVGQSDTNTVTIVNSDETDGAILNGTATLYKNNVLELQYDALADRWLETFRNF